MRAIFVVLFVVLFIQTLTMREAAGGLPSGSRQARYGCRQNCKHLENNRCNQVLPECCPKKTPSCSAA
uniref:SLPTX10 n=1 Tax=Hemiscolopendra marginata TaxID=943146 RepID=A0A646QDC3_9MYRI